MHVDVNVARCLTNGEGLVHLTPSHPPRLSVTMAYTLSIARQVTNYLLHHPWASVEQTSNLLYCMERSADVLPSSSTTMNTPETKQKRSKYITPLPKKYYFMKKIPQKRVAKLLVTKKTKIVILIVGRNAINRHTRHRIGRRLTNHHRTALRLPKPMKRDERREG